MEIRGTYTALVTPFRRGKVDLEAFRALLLRQRAAGVEGVVPCGCTGEAATLSREERKELIAAAVEGAGGGMDVVVGTGTNDTRTTIELTREAEELGATAAMLITPYYNKPTQEGLFQHFRQVARETSLPLILYNVPGRTGVNIAAETIARLFATERYVAIKEAAGSVDRVSDILNRCPITVLSGDDSLTLPMMAVGARGVVSVISNLEPGAVKEMVAAALSEDFARARELHNRLLALARAVFVETNPAPIKAMLADRGLIAEELRLPLVPLSPVGRKKMEEVLAERGTEQESR